MRTTTSALLVACQLVLAGADAEAGRIGLLAAHPHHAWAVAFSHDGKLVASTGHRSVFVFDTASGRLLTSFRTPTSCRIAFSPKGDRCAALGFDGTLAVWDLPGWRPRPPIKAHWRLSVPSWRAPFSDTDRIGGGRDLLFAPRHGKFLATAGGWKGIRITSARTGATLHVLTHGASVSSLAVSTDGALLASAGRNRIRIWRVGRWQKVLAIRTTDPVRRLAFSPDGRQLAAVVRGGAGRILVWDARTGAGAGEFAPKARIHVEALAFSPDGSRLVAGGIFGIHVWDARKRAFLGTVPVGGEDARGRVFVHDLAISPDGKRVATAHGGGQVRLTKLRLPP